jgi:hypothetical protein
LKPNSLSVAAVTAGLGKDGWGVNGDGLLTHAGVAQEPLRNNIDSDLDDSDSDASGLCRGQKAEEKNIIEPFREGDLIWVDLDMTRRQVTHLFCPRGQRFIISTSDLSGDFQQRVDALAPTGGELF